MKRTKHTIVENTTGFVELAEPAELQVSNLNATFKDKIILNDINLTLSQGEFACLCGPNGSGKTTLLSVMAGLAQPGLKFSAQLSPDFTKLPRHSAARLLAYMQQNEYSEWDFSVGDYVLQGRYAYTKFGHYTSDDYAVVEGVLEELELTQFKERSIHSLSGGEFQKIRLARSLVQTPKFLLLDEPAANLDYVFEPQLMSLLRDTAHNKNLGVLAAIHDINLAARFADRIILLPPARTSDNHPSKKSVLSGAPSDIMNTDNLKYTFGVDFECKEIKSFQSLQ